MEIENAVHQAQKELLNRFDLKGAGAEIVLEKNEIKLKAVDAFKMKTLVEIMMARLSKRAISMKNLDEGEAELSPLGHARQVIKIKQGIESAAAKEISTFVRGLGVKVTAAIQGDELRITGKNRDDLQTVMQALKGKDFPVSLSFTNFRD